MGDGDYEEIGDRRLRKAESEKRKAKSGKRKAESVNGKMGRIGWMGPMEFILKG